MMRPLHGTHQCGLIDLIPILRKRITHFTELRITYATIDSGGRLTVQHSLAPPGKAGAGADSLDLGGASDYLAALDRKEPVICSDIRSETCFGGLRDVLANKGVGAFVHLPVHHSEEIRGLLMFESPAPRSWSGDEIINMIREIDLPFSGCQTLIDLHEPPRVRKVVTFRILEINN